MCGELLLACAILQACKGFTKMVDEAQTQEIVRRVIETVRPIRIILFGSAARGEDRPGSDIDMMVVMPNGTHRLDTTQSIYRNLKGVKVAVDVVVATQADLEEYGNTPGLIFREALRDGRLLYAA